MIKFKIVGKNVSKTCQKRVKIVSKTCQKKLINVPNDKKKVTFKILEVTTTRKFNNNPFKMGGAFEDIPPPQELKGWEKKFNSYTMKGRYNFSLYTIGSIVGVTAFFKVKGMVFPKK